MLTRDGIIVISFYEQHFWEHNAYPTYELASERTFINPKRLKTLTTSADFQTALTTRGLPPFFKDTLPELLTPEQVLAVNLILNVYDKRSLQTKLKSISVTTSKWSAWLNDPNFSRHLASQIDKRFNFLEQDAKLALAKNIQDGDLNSIKFYLELTGKFSPQAPAVQVNVNLIVNRILDVLVKYVPAPTLSQIADELEMELERIGN